MRDVVRAAVVLVASGLSLALGTGAAWAEVDLGAFSGPVRFEAPPGTVLEVGDRRYIGTLEAFVGPEGDLTLVDELSFDGYLEGLAEVPVSWPDEALRAQVIAARTYVWWELEQGIWTDRGYDICATQACQVFKGRDVVEADPAGRWARAVAATSGRVLVDDEGDPVLARFSSANGGASVPNVEMFPKDGDPPYLQSVDDPHDAASPFNRWQVRFPRADFDAILARGETLAAAVPIADVELVEVDRGEDLVRVTGQDGTRAEVTATAFRFFVAGVAPEVDPDAYPPLRGDGSGNRMPATLLSQQLSFTVTDDAVVVDGRGFGHGVGMSQYGAFGKAQAGWVADDIVAAYYGGIRPTTPETLPTQVRVGLQEGAEAVEVRPAGPVRIVVGDTELTTRGLGGWRVAARDDRTLQLYAPDGYGAPLVVDPTVVADSTPWAAQYVTLQTVVNKFAEAVVEVADLDGTVLSRTSAGVLEPGRQSVQVPLEGAEGAPLEPGAYRVALLAVDEAGEQAGTAAELTIRAPAAAVSTAAALGPAPATPRGPDSPRNVAAVVVLGATLGGAVAGILGRRRTS